jgi:hypothetical protein
MVSAFVKKSLKFILTKGRKPFRVLWSDVFDVLSDGDEIVCVHIDERYFAEKGTPEQIDEFYKNVAGKNLKERLLIKKGDDFYYLRPRKLPLVEV